MRRLVLLVLVLTAFTGTMIQANKVRGEEIPSGIFYIKSANVPLHSTNKGYWDVPGNPQKIAEDMILQVWELSDRAQDRQFRFIRTTCPKDSYDCYEIQIGNTYNARVTISSGKKGKGLFKKKGGINKGQIVIERDINGNDQTWYLMHRGGGRFEINSSNNRDRIVTDNNTGNNGAKIIASNKGTHLWYLIDARTNKPFIPNQNNKPGINSGKKKSGITLDQALMNDNNSKNYFMQAGLGEFRKENMGNKLVTTLNAIGNDSNRLKKFLYILQGVNSNRSLPMRRTIYRQLMKIDSKGSGFAMVIIKTGIKKEIDNTMRRESDMKAKDLLNKLKQKF